MKTLMKKTLVAGAVASGLLASGHMAYAAQGNGEVDLKLIVPGVLILDYYSDITVTLTSDDIVSYLAGVVTADSVLRNEDSTPKALGATSDGTKITTDSAAISGAGASLTAVPLVLKDVWAVRGTGSSSGITVTATLGSGATLANGSSSVGVTAAVAGLSSGAAFPVAFPGLATGNAENGDVTLTLDLSGATTPGTYQNTAGPTYVLSATAP